MLMSTFSSWEWVHQLVQGTGHVTNNTYYALSLSLTVASHHILSV